jgi:hypothetical protein
MATTPGSDLVRELCERLGQDQSKVATTIRLNATTIKRLRAQEKRWNTTQSFLIEKALEPVLVALEAAQLPGEDGSE